MSNVIQRTSEASPFQTLLIRYIRSDPVDGFDQIVRLRAQHVVLHFGKVLSFALAAGLPVGLDLLISTDFLLSKDLQMCSQRVLSSSVMTPRNIASFSRFFGTGCEGLSFP